jgi:hypothetical protein
MVVTCNYALVENLAANLACAVVAVAPSLVAVALSASVVRRHPRPNARDVMPALAAMLLGLAIVVWAFVGTVSEWMHPSPTPPCP